MISRMTAGWNSIVLCTQASKVNVGVGLLFVAGTVLDLHQVTH